MDYFTMLSGEAEMDVEVCWRLSEVEDQGAELDGFGPGAEYEE